MKNIYLVRHGRQNSRLCNVDVPLAEQGVEQARLLAERIKGYEIELIYSSHLMRAVETANILAEELKVPQKMEQQWKEIDFGDLTGHSDEYNKKEFQWFFTRQQSMTSDLSYPNGECGQDVITRVMPKLEALTREKADSIVVVTHGGVIRALVAHLMGAPLQKKLGFARKLENTSITQIVFEEEKKQFRVERINDYAHLESSPILLRDNWKQEDKLAP